MDLRGAYVCHSDEWNLAVVLCFFWPIIAAGLLRSRQTSTAPIAAIVAPFAVSVALMWHGLYNVLLGMARSGAWRPAAMFGVSDALSAIKIGAASALAVAIIAALRRHRPVLDRTTASLVALTLLSVFAVLAYSRWLALGGVPQIAHGYFFVAGAIASVIVAAAAVVWAFLEGLAWNSN